eukprot:5553333-Amphidinium_carterae.2
MTARIVIGLWCVVRGLEQLWVMTCGIEEAMTSKTEDPSIERCRIQGTDAAKLLMEVTGAKSTMRHSCACESSVSLLLGVLLCLKPVCTESLGPERKRATHLIGIPYALLSKSSNYKTPGDVA